MARPSSRRGRSSSCRARRPGRPDHDSRGGRSGSSPAGGGSRRAGRSLCQPATTTRLERRHHRGAGWHRDVGALMEPLRAQHGCPHAERRRDAASGIVDGDAEGRGAEGGCRKKETVALLQPYGPRRARRAGRWRRRSVPEPTALGAFAPARGDLVERLDDRHLVKSPSRLSTVTAHAGQKAEVLRCRWRRAGPRESCRRPASARAVSPFDAVQGVQHPPRAGEHLRPRPGPAR